MVTAVICEYNPFHKGHKYQLDEIRRLKPNTKILSVMSPGFVQRGQPAVFDKYVRGECAVRCGADIAVSMPQVFSLLSAEGFAEGGVKVAREMGADSLAFGVENDDAEALKSVARILISDEFEQKLKEQLDLFPSLSFPSVRQKALECLCDKEVADMISTPNNILAIEYIKAIMRYCPDMEILPIKRTGNGHSDISESGEVLSATAIRRIIHCDRKWETYVPKETLTALDGATRLDSKLYEAFLFSALSVGEYEKILRSAGNKELADTVATAVRESGSYTEFRQKLSRKKFPETKIDRMLVCCLLGIACDEYMHSDPEYVTFLASNDHGRDILKQCKIPVISRYADGKRIGGKQCEKELLADRIWARCTLSPMGEKYFIEKKPYTAEDIQ